MNELLLTAVFFLSALDAMRDGFRTSTFEGITSKQWHYVKWLSWYPLMIILVLQMDILYIIASPFIAWLGWRWGLMWTPVKWQTMWFIKLKLLWNWIKNLFHK